MSQRSLPDSRIIEQGHCLVRLPARPACRVETSHREGSPRGRASDQHPSRDYLSSKGRFPKSVTIIHGHTSSVADNLRTWGTMVSRLPSIQPTPSRRSVLTLSSTEICWVLTPPAVWTRSSLPLGPAITGMGRAQSRRCAMHCVEPGTQTCCLWAVGPCCLGGLRRGRKNDCSCALCVAAAGSGLLQVARMNQSRNAPLLGGHCRSELSNSDRPSCRHRSEAGREMGSPSDTAWPAVCGGGCDWPSPQLEAFAGCTAACSGGQLMVEDNCLPLRRRRDSYSSGHTSC